MSGMVKAGAKGIGRLAGEADKKLDNTIGSTKAGYVKGGAKMAGGLYLKGVKKTVNMGVTAGGMVAKYTSLDDRAKAMYKEKTGKDFDESVEGAKAELKEIADALEQGHAEGKGS